MSSNPSINGNVKDTTTPQNAAHNDSVVVENEEPAEESADSTRSLCIFSWNVKMPSLEKPRNKLGIGNHLLPNLMMKTTKITIDLEQPTTTAFDPGRTAILLKDDETISLHDDESVLLRIWQRGETSVSSVIHRDSKGWVEHGVYRLDEVKVAKVDGHVSKIQFGSDRDLVARQVHFVDEEDAQRFQTFLQKMSALEQARAQRQLVKYRSCQSDLSMDENERIQLLVEIASVKGIPKNVEPYVSIRMSGKLLHRTDCATSILGSAIYTLEEQCFYLLDVTLAELFASSGGLTFSVMDKDSIALKGGLVGRTTVPLDRILHATGERESYSLDPTTQTGGSQQTNEDDSRPILYIRMRRATPDDIEFMAAYTMASNKHGVFSEETFLPVRPPPGDTLRIKRKPMPHGKTLHRVKPFCDPDRPEETKWMTKDQLREEALKPSTHWVEAGSGSLGKVFIEVIGCDGLPNMDRRKIGSRTTDGFACVVFEDSIVNTDVIVNSTCPRWMPWCRRAFVFNVLHPSSNILLGLFDWDMESSPVQMAMSVATDVHDPIARVMVNVANAVPDTVYTVTYPLYFAKAAKHREKQLGTITLRLRKEIYDKREMLLVGMKPPPPIYISVAKTNDFRCCHYTTEGDLNEEAYSLNKFTDYIEELQSYDVVLEYIKAAALSVLLWRGHYEVTIADKTLMLPINSLLAFIWGVLLSNNYDRFPSFVLFCIGWMMVACNEQARRPPSPWEQARSYRALLEAALFNAYVEADSIAPNEGAVEMDLYRKQLEEKAERRKQVGAEYQRKLDEELGNDAVDQDDDEIISTKQRILDKLSINPVMLPFKSTLYPIQKELRKRVLQLRIGTSIVTWQERIYAFWITTLSFIAAALCFCVPWSFLLKWILRIAAWVVLGPWAALIARYRFPEMNEISDDDWEEYMKNRLQERREKAVQASTRIQINKEYALKRKAMSRWMFGQFHLRSPRFSEELFPDVPLPSSFAEPYNPETNPPVQIKERVYGQNLYGDMIPQREVHVDSLQLMSSKQSVFLDAGLGSYFDDAYGWAQFMNVSKVAYGIGYGTAKGEVFAKTTGTDAKFVGSSTLMLASAGWSIGATLASEIIFFQNVDAFNRFKSGNFSIEGGAKVNILSLTAGAETGSKTKTTGVPFIDRLIESKTKGGNGEEKRRYQNGTVTFVIVKVGMMFDMSVVGQKFSFHPAGTT